MSIEPLLENRIYYNVQHIFYRSQSSRTPGSRQPSPAEEHLNRLHGLDPSVMNVSGFSQPHMMQHMMNSHDQHQISSSFHPQHQQHHPMGHPVLNGMQVQVIMIFHLFVHFLTLLKLPIFSFVANPKFFKPN